MDEASDSTVEHNFHSLDLNEKLKILLLQRDLSVYTDHDVHLYDPANMEHKQMLDLYLERLYYNDHRNTHVWKNPPNYWNFSTHPEYSSHPGYLRSIINQANGITLFTTYTVENGKTMNSIINFHIMQPEDGFILDTIFGDDGESDNNMFFKYPNVIHIRCSHFFRNRDLFPSKTFFPFSSEKMMYPVYHTILEHMELFKIGWIFFLYSWSPLARKTIESPFKKRTYNFIDFEYKERVDNPKNDYMVIHGEPRGIILGKYENKYDWILPIFAYPDFPYEKRNEIRRSFRYGDRTWSPSVSFQRERGVFSRPVNSEYTMHGVHTQHLQKILLYKKVLEDIPQEKRILPQIRVNPRNTRQTFSYPESSVLDATMPYTDNIKCFIRIGSNYTSYDGKQGS